MSLSEASQRGRPRRPEGTRSAGRRVGAAALAAMAVAFFVFALTGCGAARETQTSGGLAPVILTSTVTTLPSTTATTAEAPTEPPVSAWHEVELLDRPPAEPFRLRLSDELLVFDTTDHNDLYAYVFATERLVRLPVEGRARAFDVEGSLVVWTESQGPTSPASTWAYRMPQGPRINVLSEHIDASDVRLNEGRLFYSSWHEVDGGASEGETLYRCPITMLPLDASGRPEGIAVLVTEQPKAAHEPGGDELWDFDVSGPNLAYQVDWGPERGTHLLDLETGGVVALGPGAIPSISSSAVLWQVGGEKQQVREYDLATRKTATLSFGGRMPFAGPDYAAYVQPGSAAALDQVTMLDGKSAARSVLGSWQPPDGWPFLSMDGTDRRFAWVSRSNSGDSKVRLYER